MEGGNSDEIAFSNVSFSYEAKKKGAGRYQFPGRSWIDCIGRGIRLRKEYNYVAFNGRQKGR